ncbi:restriction endonuclease subunit S [Streptococcus alactolyticus]|uniref:restriction endonuclease subunit S n=1 Tax=Streptococcus alactolyticus TaxID=29389 RepID=UPI003CFFD569
MKTNGVPKIRFKGFTDDWEQRKLGEILKYEQPGPYIVNSTDYDDSFSTPVLTAGQSFILGYTNETEGIKYASKENPVIIFDDFTTSSHLVDFPFKVKSSAMKLLSLRKNEDDIYFMVNTLKNIKYIPASHERHWISIFSEFNIPIPCNNVEQQKIGEYFSNLDRLITLHQRKCDQTKELKKFMLQKMFPKKGEKNPEIRFPGFTDDWEQRKFGELYEKVSRKNDMTYGTEQIISVANMYYKVDANVKRQDYLKTYNIFELGDIAFEGNKSKHFAHGRFVENTIGNGIVSHVFDVFKPIMDFNLSFWKYYINYEGVMGPILTRVTKASTMMTNLVAKDFLNEDILVPSIAEQQKIGEYLSNLDHLITLHQRKCEQLKELKKFMLQNMFPKKG